MGEGLGMRRVAILLLMGLLAGCAGGIDAPSTQAQLATAAREALRRDDKAPPVQVTRAMLDKFDGALLEAHRERTGQRAVLGVALRRQDSIPGRITVWRSRDDITLALRGEALIATRGLGGDLLSSDGAGAGEKVLHIRGLDNKERRMVLRCSRADLGAEVVDVVERRHSTRHIRETCEGADGVATYDYWIEPGTGITRQSRQWAGPDIGYLTLRQLTD